MYTCGRALVQTMSPQNLYIVGREILDSLIIISYFKFTFGFNFHIVRYARIQHQNFYLELFFVRMSITKKLALWYASYMFVYHVVITHTVHVHVHHLLVVKLLHQFLGNLVRCDLMLFFFFKNMGLVHVGKYYTKILLMCA